jgi:hypothetical protein
MGFREGDVCVARDTVVLLGDGGRSEGLRVCSLDRMASAR